MAKADLIRDAEKLGIEGLDDSFTNKQIQNLIDEATAEASESDQEPSYEPEAAPVSEDSSEATEEVSEAPVASEPVFDIKQFRSYAEQVFGVGYHVLVGAQSAGCFPAGKLTKAQITAGIDQYLNMPVDQGKEG